MKKILSILFLTSLISVAASAQDGDRKISVVLGNNPMFNQNQEYLLGNYGSSTTGLDYAPEYYLNLGAVGSNNIANMIGVQLGYYLGPLEVNAMFSMDISATPKKDFVEGVTEIGGKPLNEASLPASKYIEGSVKDNWYFNVGANFHFFESKKVSAYGGARVGYEKGRLQTVTPYTGNLESNVWYKNNRAGKISAFQVGVVAGAECTTDCGFMFGIEFSPLAYQYSLIHVDPNDSYEYVCNNHSVKIFSNPQLKLGLRF